VAQNAETAILLKELAPPERLAVAYAPAAARPLWIALLALDQRLSRAVREASEPLIAQLKLAWWRDRLRTTAAQWPAGEPLLALLRPFDGEREALEALVDAWEGTIARENKEAELAALAAARSGAVGALGRVIGCKADPGPVMALARQWTYPGAEAGRSDRLPRALRPLVILANLPALSQGGLPALARIVRLGMVGR
jgi:phytoene synthase